MVSAFVSMMLMLTPMGSGHGNHFGWRNKETRNVPAYQPVTAAPKQGNSTPPSTGSGPSEPGSTRYSAE